MYRLRLMLLLATLLSATNAQSSIEDAKIQTVKSLYQEAREDIQYGNSDSEFSVLYSYANNNLKRKINLFESSNKNYDDGMTNECGDTGYDVLRLTKGNSYDLNEVGGFEFKSLRNGDVRAIMHITDPSFAIDSYIDSFGDSTEYKDFDVECLSNECRIADIHKNGISRTNVLEYVCAP